MKGSPCVAGCRCRRHRLPRASAPAPFDARAVADAVLRGEVAFHVIDVLPGERITTHAHIEEVQRLVGNDYAPRIEALAKFGTHSQYTCEWRSVRHINDDLRAAGFVLSDD